MKTHPGKQQATLSSEPLPCFETSQLVRMVEGAMVSALGLDLGAKRIGVAGCDRTGLIATGLTTLQRTNFKSVLAPLRDLVQARAVEVLVVGLPYTMDGQIGTQAQKTQKMARRLSVSLDLPVEFVDERLTSFEAEQMLVAQRRSLARNKGLVDRKAAEIILQQWLDERRASQITPRRTPNDLI